MTTNRDDDRVLGIVERPGVLARLRRRRLRGPRPPLRFRFIVLLLASAGLLLQYGCEAPEPVREYFREPTPYEEYRLGLARAGLSNTAVGQDWIRTGTRALREAPEVPNPYSEEGFFPAEEPMALAYRISMERGQLLAVDLELESSGTTRLFVDLYRAAPDTTRTPVPVAHADSGGPDLRYEAPRDGDYILRIQPELLRGGRYTLSLRVGASMDFPVAGRDTRAIQSFFGAPRDGGRRSHHGVDIFAPRNTPVVAATDGVVRRVSTSRLGGRVVWLRDTKRSASLYYAHLEEQLVRSGQRVQAGDTLGLVGNSGNARTTPPHLHFGIYRRGEGPVNPWTFLHEPAGDPMETTVSLEQVGSWVRVTTEGLRLRDRPTAGGTVVAELPLFTAVRVVAGAGDWYRVRLPDGRAGFLAGRLTEALEVPLRTEVAAAPAPLKSDPDPGAPVVETVSPGSDVDVLGAFGDYLYVRSRGRPGWMAGSP